MAGITSLPIAATALTVNGTINGAIGIASVTGWTLSSQVALADSTTTAPVMATIVSIDVANNLLYLRTNSVPSEGWAQMVAEPGENGPPPGLNTMVSWNSTDMRAWTTAHSATVTQIPTFVYTTLVPKKKKGNPAPLFTLRFSNIMNTRTTPAFQTNADGTLTLLSPGVTRQESAGFLNENAAQNQLAYSQLIGFNDGSAGWTPDDTPTLQDAAAPDGTMTATKMTTVAGNSQHRLYQSITVNNAMSIYVKAGPAPSARYLSLGDSSGTVAYGSIDLQTGQFVTGIGCTGRVDALADGWYRLSVYGAGGGISSYFTIFVGETAIAPGGYTAVGGYSICVWGAQGETTAFPTSYFPTNTNFIADANNMADGGVWGTQQAGASAAPTITAKTTDVPDPLGGFNANKVTLGAVVGSGDYSAVYAVCSTGGTVAATGSIYLRTLTGTVTIPIWGNGSVSTVCVLTSTWQRFSVTDIPNPYLLIGAFFGHTSINQPACTIYCWGAQKEPGTVPSSFFDTTLSGVTTTRAADLITFANPLYGLNPASWGVGFTATPLDTWANVVGAGLGCFMNFGANNTANCVRWFDNGGDFNNDYYDSSDGQYVVGTSVNPSAADPYTFTSHNASGVITGTPGTFNFSGAGTGIITTQQATVTLGNFGGFTTYPVIGWFKNVYIDNV